MDLARLVDNVTERSVSSLKIHIRTSGIGIYGVEIDEFQIHSVLDVPGTNNNNNNNKNGTFVCILRSVVKLELWFLFDNAFMWSADTKEHQGNPRRHGENMWNAKQTALLHFTTTNQHPNDSWIAW